MEVPGNLGALLPGVSSWGRGGGEWGGRGEGVIDQGLHCWCEENYQCLGGRGPPAQAESLWTDLGRHLVHSPGLRSPCIRRGLYLPNRTGAHWKMGNEADYGSPRPNPSFPLTSLSI